MPAVFPAAADLRLGVKAGPTTGEEIEGTLDLPAVADVRRSTKFDGQTKTGTLQPMNLPLRLKGWRQLVGFAQW